VVVSLIPTTNDVVLLLSLHCLEPCVRVCDRMVQGTWAVLLLNATIVLLRTTLPPRDPGRPVVMATKLSFRARALDASKPLPVYRYVQHSSPRSTTGTSSCEISCIGLVLGVSSAIPRLLSPQRVPIRGNIHVLYHRVLDRRETAL